MMASLLEAKSMALEYVHQVRTKLTGTDDDSQTYHQFSHTLKLFRRRLIHPSTAVAAVQKLFHNHPDLLHAFKPFVPTNYSEAAAAVAAEDPDLLQAFVPTHHSAAAAVAAEDPDDLKACVDFLKRVGTCSADNGVYCKFLSCMNSYSRGEITVSEVRIKIDRLFGKNQDLVALFKSFLPESYIQQRSNCKKRKINDHVEDPLMISTPQQPPTKKRNSNIPRKEQSIISRYKTIDFNIEDSLCEVDVKIGNLESTYNNAQELMRRLFDGHLSPSDVCVNDHFTPLNLACIRNLSRKLLDNLSRQLVENPASAISETMNKVMKKKEALERSRVEIIEKWVKIRQSWLSQLQIEFH